MKKLKSYYVLFALICSCTLFTSCFDFIEEINLKTDGSGTIKATLNLSKSSTKVASLMKLKSVNGIQIPSKEKIKKETEDMIRILKNTEGISQVQHSLDFNNYIATVSCNFASVRALNSFSKALATHFKSSLGTNNSYAYDTKTRVFSRSYTYAPAINKEFSRISEADKKFFNDAFYTQIIRFDQTVKAQQHAAGKISSSAKAVLLKLKATDLITGKASLANAITLNNK
ncbi:hypothetical protein LZQ00_06700 [Sphingobacterium sp. SRCM116780]|uniref:hypothetical protein n=1 Tax=Sphingobacterium sp. SRCM116780 TaxID=2907623 RepID=UPI001F2E1E26|nr:hypothetical protein [Sphingobacterium sp. SRCM116780]UIR57502.1 hypothetical protein LZQ00_06700 [Sphingobacterium sp. SRCM116780]